MWPLPRIEPNIVNIVFNQQTLSCSWIQYNAKQACTPLTLKAYRSFEIASESTHTLIFNPTEIHRHISSFLTAHSLTNAFISMALSGSSIIESIVELSTASPRPTDFTFPKLATIEWDYRYLYPYENRYAFYVCGMHRHLIAQYQLLAISAGFNITLLTTERMALFSVYKKRYGTTFRHSQLARDMQLHNNDIRACFTSETIRRHLYIPSHVDIAVEREYTTLLTHIGLFFSQENHETY